MVQAKTRGEQFRRRTLLRLANEARRRARPLVPSRTLRRDMQVFVDQNERGIVQIPYFWAVYVHDGREPFGVHRRSRKGRREPNYLVWFKNPRDDPRTQGGSKYPRREQEVRQLTRAQWEAGLERNRQRASQGRDPFMVVVKRVEKPAPGVPFFERGLAGFDQIAAPIVLEEFEKLISLETISDEDTVTLRL